MIIPKKTIIFIHGMWSRGEISKQLEGVFDDSCEFHAPDLPEHGGYQDIKKVKTFSISDYVEFVDQFIDNLEDQQGRELILIGHSMGGLIAQKVAEQREIDGLVLLNSVPPAGIHLLSFSYFWANRFVFGLTGLLFRSVHRPSFKQSRFAIFNKLSESLASEYHETLNFDSGRCLLQMVFWWLDFDQAIRIEKPVSGRKLIIGCGQDRIIRPKISEKLRDRYPESTYRLFPSNGHWVFGEPNSDNIIRTIADWVCPHDRVPHHYLSDQSTQAIQKVF